jgi:hypothetical protein
MPEAALAVAHPRPPRWQPRPCVFRGWGHAPGGLPWRHAGAGPIRWLDHENFKNSKYFNDAWRMRWKRDGKTCIRKRRKAADELLARDGDRALTLGNMRANGVRSLDVSCWQCRHRAILSADPWPDHVRVPSFGPRMVCTRESER